MASRGRFQRLASTWCATARPNRRGRLLPGDGGHPPARCANTRSPRRHAGTSSGYLELGRPRREWSSGTPISPACREGTPSRILRADRFTAAACHRQRSSGAFVNARRPGHLRNQDRQWRKQTGLVAAAGVGAAARLTKVTGFIDQLLPTAPPLPVVCRSKQTGFFSPCVVSRLRNGTTDVRQCWARVSLVTRRAGPSAPAAAWCAFGVSGVDKDSPPAALSRMSEAWTSAPSGSHLS